MLNNTNIKERGRKYQENRKRKAKEELVEKDIKKQKTDQEIKKKSKKELKEENKKKKDMNRVFSIAKRNINNLNSYNLVRWMQFNDKSQIIQKKIKQPYNDNKNEKSFIKKNKGIKNYNLNHEYLKNTKYEIKKYWGSDPILYNKTYIEKNMLFPCTEELNKNGISENIFSNPEIFLYKIIGMKPKLTIKSDKFHTRFPYYAFCTGKIDRKIFIGRGHGKTVAEARNNACLFFISKIYEKKLLFNMIEENQIGNYDNDLVSKEANAKLDILNYACRWLALPKFEVSISYTKIKKKKIYTVTAYTEEPKLAGTGRSYDHRIAEILACVNFKKIAEEHHLENDQDHLLIKNWENLNTSNAKKFIQFFEYKIKRGKTETIFKTKNNFWIASIKAGERILAVSPEMYTKKDSEEACFLVYALNIRKEMPHLFVEYIEELKKGNGEFLRPLSLIPTNISDKSLKIMKETISQLKNIQTSENFEEIYSEKEKDLNWLPFKPSLEFLKQRSETLLKQLKALKKGKNQLLNDLFEKKQKLPIFSYKNNLLTLIKENPVCIIIGATGSGKTTQLPQFIFEDAILNNIGAECNILCTQPRKIAAISVAQRVCFERNEKLQESIGYQVRFDNKLAKPVGSINYCTTGILLRQLQDLSSSILERVSHIIVDEVHERSIQTDFLLFVLKKIMKKRKSSGLTPIKIILMSATVDPTLFCKYFGEEFPDKQAPSIFIPGFSFPVSSYFLEDIYQNLKNTFSKKQAPALFDKDTTLYLKSENIFNSNSCKEKEMEITENESNNHSSPIDWSLKNPSNQEELSFMNEKDISDGLIATTISYIIKTSDDGSILVFLPGYSEINSLNKVLLSGRAGLDFSDKFKYRIYMLHSAIPHMQQEVFKKLEPGIRKIILATNIAETSITIPDVVYVVDTCKHREKIYDQTKRITSLLSTWISHSNSKQRAGRAGRVKDGHYYALISKNRYAALAPASLPEILRSDLQEICLQIKAIGMKDSVSKVLSETIEAPSKKAVENGLQRLYSLGALDENENLTPLGTILATLPVEPSLGKMCLMGAIFKCLDPVLILAASASLRNIFVQPIDLQEECRKARTKLSMDYKSDHITIINCFKKWRSIQKNEGNISASDFIEKNFLHRNTLQTIDNVAKQILQILVDHKIISHKEVSEELGGEELNKYSDCIPLIKSLICAGFYPNIAVITNKRLLRTCNDNTVLIHPSSINFPKSSNKNLYGPPISEDITPPGTLYAFGSKSKTDSLKSLILRDTTLLNPLSVLLFGGKLTRHNNIIRIDNWIPFHVKNTQNYIIYEFNEYMDKILTQIFNKLHIQSHHSQTHDILNENKSRNIIVKGVVDALYANT
ncbi:hypothetical protein PNEG_01172 [Pneumocystis murina B123]|uniref:RNA helicase n=1 Tax=Pneumocystis murina (strain B123) TaxID=1069680 RepID=M7NP22_PNEMU|nr:hypothetical protein PNEG_01172 [Pneumocystis murina B123]EMR10458.1 hypothetical protein PNEG_01172 [Pneumocystis murina B123]